MIIVLIGKPTNEIMIYFFQPMGIEGPGLKFCGPLGECPEERKGGTGMSRSKSFNCKFYFIIFIYRLF